jgi:acetyltransferase-like isoleucine patch superfamily enzyme
MPDTLSRPDEETRPRELARATSPRAVAKGIANGLAALTALPCVLAFRAAGMAMGRGRAFPGWSEAFALIPGLGGVYLRRAFYRAALPKFGEDACLGFGSIVSGPGAEFGRRVYVGPFCCLGEVALEDDVLIGAHVSVMNGGAQHGTGRTDVPIRDQPGTWPPVKVGRGSWIGDRAVVMADVGRHCVIGAGAVVSRPIPDYAVAVGVPARVIRFRDRPGPVTAAASAPEPNAAVRP